MINAGTAMGYLDLDISKFNNGIQNATKQLDVFNNGTATTGQKMEALGGAMTSVGSNMTKYLTVPLVAVGALSIKTAADFEAGMSKVSALSGATGSDLKMLEDKAKEMGASTKFSATEASEAMSYMALAGWDANQMADGLGPSLYLAGAAGMDLARTTDIVTDTMSMFGLEASQAGEMTDMLAYAQANSNTDVNQLGEALKYCGASANAMGYDLADTTALLGVFADQGLKGSSAGTTLNAMFRDMKKNSEEGAIAIGDSSVAIVDAQGNYRDMTDILADVEIATKDMSMAEKDMALSSIFGTEALKGVNMALEAGTPKLRELEEGIRNSEGAAKEMYETMQDNLKGAIDNFKSALEGAAIVIGERLIPMFQGLVEWLTEGLTWFNNLDEGTQTFIVTIGAVVAAIGPLLMVGGALLTMLPNMVIGFGLAKDAAIAMNVAVLGVPVAIGLLIAAIVALVVAIGTNANALDFLQDKFGIFGEVLGGLCEFISGVVQLTFGNMIIIITTAAEAIGAILSGNFSQVDDIVREGWAKVENNTAEAMSNILVETSQGLKYIKESTEQELQGVVNTFDLAMQQLPNLTRDNASEMAQVFSDNMGNLDTESLTILRGTSDSMAVLFEGIKEKMDPQLATDKFTANLESMAASGKFSAETLQTDIDAAMKLITENMLVEGEAFKQTATDVFNQFKTVGQQSTAEMVNNVVTEIQGMDQSTFTALTGMGTTWSGIFQGISMDGSMNAMQMKEQVNTNISTMGLESADLISKLRTESSAYMKSMESEADTSTKGMKDKVTTNVKETEKAVDDGTKGAKDKGTKNVKELEVNVDTSTKGAAQKASANTKTLEKNTDTDTKSAGSKAKTNMETGGKGVASATSKMSSDVKKDTGKIATDIDTDFKKGTQSVTQEATNMYNGAKTSFTKLSEVAKQAGSDAYNGIRVSFELMPGIVQTAVDSAATKASSKTAAFKTAGSAAGQAWIDGFNSKKAAMASAVASIPTVQSMPLPGEQTPMPFATRESQIATSVSSSLSNIANSTSIIASFRKSGEDSANAYVEGLSKIMTEVEKMMKENEKQWLSGSSKVEKAQKAHTEAMAKIAKDKNDKIMELDKGLNKDKANSLAERNKKEKELDDKRDKEIAEANKKYAKSKTKRNEAIKKANDKFNTEQKKNEEKYQADLLKGQESYTEKKDKIMKDSNEKEDAQMKKRAEEIKKLGDERIEIEKNYHENIEKIKETYNQKVADLNEKYINEEQKLNDEYEKIYNSRVKSLMGWSDIFSEVKNKEGISGDKLMDNLQGQVDTFKSWDEDMNDLAGRVGNDLYEELLAKGPQAHQEIAALNQLSKEELERYESLFKEKKALAEKRAKEDTKAEKDRIEKQITELAVKYKEEYEKLAKQLAEDVEKQVDIVKDKFGTVPPELLEAGKSSIGSFIDGLNSKKSELTSAVNGIVSSVTNALQGSLSAVTKSVSDMYKVRDMDINLESLVYSNHLARGSILDDIKGSLTPLKKDNKSKNKKEEHDKTQITISNTYNSPKPISIRDLKRQDEIQMRRLAMKLKF